MSEISKTYDPKLVEEKWYSKWLEKGCFHSEPSKDKEPFVVVIPPPNVTGVLHMGHMLNNTIQDVLVRRARMQGKEACWVPGTDHASIATETKVVNLLAEKGISKYDLSREDFLEHAWEWKEKYGGIILEQLKKLGASCDWDRTKFTMDKDLSESVIKVFCDLYEKGFIYRGVRMVNWDPKGLTALSDEEVIYKEVNSKLYHLKYQVAGSDEFVTIATTRPETILGDTAICIHPEDERYTHLHGKKAIVPIVNREIPIILDEYVDKEFGTGCLKVTPAHDINDYELGVKHKLESIDIFNDNGTVKDIIGFYANEDRFRVRKQIIRDLTEIGAFDGDKDIKNNVGYSERTDVVIEPKLSTQWFCKMEEMAKPALENVMNDEIKIHPPKFKNMYRSWMENIRDWCISRQLWWGHRIPAYYLPNGEFVVAATDEEALEKAKAINPSITADQLKQDDDVLDTWFSSWLWPMSVFNGINDPENEEFKYYYPTNDLVTGFDIIFFWVARMIMAGYEFGDKLPFKNVYITGMVRDGKGRKMSKSLGNSPDPIDLINTYSADGVRTGMLFSAPAGNDLLFDEKLCEQGRNFTNKVWNSFRLVKGWEVVDADVPAENKVALNWIQNKIKEALADINQSFEQYRVSEALMTVYKLVWDDFCSWYLELVKPEFGKPIDRTSFEATISIFEELLKLVHPFMPFISEEIWSQLKDREENDLLIKAAYPTDTNFEKSISENFAKLQEIVTLVRNTRNEKGLSPKEKLKLIVKTSDQGFYNNYEKVIQKLANTEDLEFTDSKIDNAVSQVVKSDELFIPLEGKIDLEEEKQRIQKELDYTKGFLKSVEKKLSNERFVSGAPEAVVNNEKKKRDDAEAQIKALEASLAAM